MPLEKVTSGGHGDNKRTASQQHIKNLVTEAEAENDLMVIIIVAAGTNLKAKARVKTQIKVLLILVRLAVKRNCMTIRQQMPTDLRIGSLPK